MRSKMRKMVKRLPQVPYNKRFTISDAADILQVPTCRLYVHIRTGKLQASRREVDGLMVVTGKEIVNYWHLFN